MEVLGIIAAITSAASWAFGTLMFDRLGKHVPPVGITFIKGSLSIVFMALLTLFCNGFASIGSIECLYLALSGIIGIAIGDTLFFKSLKDLGGTFDICALSLYPDNPVINFCGTKEEWQKLKATAGYWAEKDLDESTVICNYKY